MHFFKSFLIGFSLMALLCMPAAAANYKIESSIAPANEGISTITVTVGEKVLNEKVRYGPRDIERMKSDLYKKVQRRLDREGLLRKEGGAKLVLTLVDMAPNQPTMFDLTQRTNLNFYSASLGRAEISARLIGADGAALGKMQYRYRNTKRHSFNEDQAVWYSAKYAFDTFARRLAAALKVAPAS